MSAEESKVQESHEANQEHRRESHRLSTGGIVYEISTRMRMSYGTDSIQLPNYNSASTRHRNSYSRDHKEGKSGTTYTKQRRDTSSSDESWKPTTRQQMSLSVSAETSISYVESITESFVQDLLHDDDNAGSYEEFAPDAAGLFEHEITYHKITASEEEMMMQDDTRSTNTIVFFTDLVKRERKSMANALLFSSDPLKGTNLAPRKARVSLPKDEKFEGRIKCCRAIRKYFRRLSRKLFKNKRKKRAKGRRSLYEDGESLSDTDEDLKCTVQGASDENDSEFESEQVGDSKKPSDADPGIRNKLGIPKRIPLTAALISLRIRIIRRKRTIAFFQFIMGMRMLRHEEHGEKEDLLVGDKYTGRWSKTVMSYDDNCFALELIYYYDTKSFKKGNGLICLIVQNNEALFRAKQFDWPIKAENRLVAPGGYIFQIVDRPLPKDKDPISKIIITSTNLQKSIKFWCGFLEMNIMVEKRQSITLSYGKNQIRLEIRYISPPFIQGDNTVRLKAVCPYSQLMELQMKFLKMPNRIKQHMTIYAYTKPTNVKIAVFVDYDGHEVAYIDQESYSKVLKSMMRNLSRL